jgi:uncharacterized protein
MRAGFSLLLSILACLLIGGAHAEVEVPPLRARVTDLTNTLDAQQRDALEQKLAAFEAAKGSQIAVLIVPTTQPEAIEQYSIRVAEQWKLGRKGVDDGALLLVAKDDRKMRVEVGRGLEGAVPDAVAKRITSEIIAPYFKSGDFHGGITAGVERLIRVIEGEALPAPVDNSRSPRRNWEDSDSMVMVVVVAVAIMAILMGGFLRARLGLYGCAAGAAVLAAASGGAVWAISGVAGFGIVPAIVVFILGLLGGKFHSGSGGKWSWAWLRRFGIAAGVAGATGGGVWAISGEAEVGFFFAIVGFILGMQDFSGALSGGSSSRSSRSRDRWSSGSGSSSSSSSSGGSSFTGGGGDFGGGGSSSDW